LQDADQHLARIKGYGYNVIRFLVNWEAIEHSGPYLFFFEARLLTNSGIYDDEYVDYVVAILQKCKDHKLLVFIDPHQDVVFALA
jgi:Cellulase (glycosyl hydrolase family 5)